MQPLREVETVLVTEVDVDERHVRTELRHESNRLGTVGRNPDDVQPLTCEQVDGPLEEKGTVVDDDALHGHPLRIHNQVRVRIPANWNPWAYRRLALSRERHPLRPLRRREPTSTGFGRAARARRRCATPANAWPRWREPLRRRSRPPPRSAPRVARQS